MKASTGLVAWRRRSMAFGVKTTSGFCGRSHAWRRSRWNHDAGVEGRATIMLSSAQSCRYRSMRAEEWSGP